MTVILFPQVQDEFHLIYCLLQIFVGTLVSWPFSRSHWELGCVPPEKTEGTESQQVFRSGRLWGISSELTGVPKSEISPPQTERSIEKHRLHPRRLWLVNEEGTGDWSDAVTTWACLFARLGQVEGE